MFGKSYRSVKIKVNQKPGRDFDFVRNVIIRERLKKGRSFSCSADGRKVCKTTEPTGTTRTNAAVDGGVMQYMSIATANRTRGLLELRTRLLADRPPEFAVV